VEQRDLAIEPLAVAEQAVADANAAGVDRVQLDARRRSRNYDPNRCFRSFQIVAPAILVEALRHLKFIHEHTAGSTAAAEPFSAGSGVPEAR
jgi:hypothetical protein